MITASMKYANGTTLKVIFYEKHIMEHFHSVGHNEVIGVCQVGNDAESLGRDHWNEMLSYPRKPIAHWHPLAEVRIFPCFPITITVKILVYGIRNRMKFYKKNQDPQVYPKA